MAGKSLWEELEATGHPVFAVRDQRAMNAGTRSLSVIQSRLPTTVTNLIKGAQEPILQRIPDLIHLTNENNTQTSLQY